MPRVRWCEACGAKCNGRRCASCAGYGQKRHVMPSGYIRVWLPGHPMANSDGYALEHRVVVYDAGIAVPDGHHVHHKNHDKTDNRLENLEVFEGSEHHRHHIREAGKVTNQHGTFPVLTGDARRERNRELRAIRRARLAADPSVVRHGKEATYSQWGCRCELCREAKRIARARLRAAFRDLETTS